MINLSIHGINTLALVDTGSPCTIMNESHFKFICERTHRQPISKTTRELCSASGHPLQVLGEVKMPIGPGFFSTLIVRNLPHVLILGGDCLKEGEGIVDYGSRIVTLFDKDYPFKLRTVVSVLCAVTQTRKWEQRYPQAFATEFRPLGRVKTRCLIDTGDHAPIKMRAYRAPLAKRQVIEDEVEKMLAAGVIEPSKSPWAAPVTLAPKSDGTIRFCSDYRRLNSVTKKDCFPMPHVQDIFDQLGGSRLFSTLDLKSGYWQCPMDPDSVEKTAFITHQGLYQYKVMPFGLCNAPGVFQRLMQEILHDVIGKYVMVYIDDIVIYSKTEAEHEAHTKVVLERLIEAGLTLKSSKCTFDAREVKLLGFVVNENGIQTNPEKVSAIRNLAPPRTLKELRRFLGMSGYYRTCVRDYAAISASLTELMKKGVVWEWTEIHQKSFDALKEALVGSEVIAYPDPTKPYKLFTDSSDYALGAVLVQCVNGVEKVIQYVSKKLNPAQRKWAVIEKEAWAVVYALKKLRPYLYGAEFTIYTDHKPLKSLFLGEVNNTKVQRWAVLISEYGAPIEYRQGKNNIRADMLSRILPLEQEVAVIDSAQLWSFPPGDNEDESCIPWADDELDLQDVVLEQSHMPEYELAQDQDVDRYILTGGVMYDVSDEDGGVKSYPRLVLPPSCRERVIRRAHFEVGHQGVSKTLWRIKEAYKWTGMRKHVKALISRCNKCTVFRDTQQRSRPGTMPVPTYANQILGMDLTGPFELSSGGNRYILVVIDHATGWAEAKPIPTKEEENILNYLDREYFPRFGIPEVIVSDLGGEFTGHTLKTYLSKLNIDHRHTCPYSPQSNGMTERFNRTIKQLIRKLVNNCNSRWEDELGHALFAHRVSTSATTGYTPFYLTYGRRPRAPVTSMLRELEVSDSSVVSDRLEGLARAFKDATHNTRESRDYNRRLLEKRATKQDIKVGDTVVLKNNTATQFQQKWHHEFEVIRVSGSVLKCRHQQSGVVRTVNRRQARLVPRDMVWDLPPTPAPVVPRQRDVLPRAAKQRPVRYEDDADWVPDPIRPPVRRATKRGAGDVQEEEEIQVKRRLPIEDPPPPEGIEVDVEARKRAGSTLEDGPSVQKKPCADPTPAPTLPMDLEESGPQPSTSGAPATPYRRRANAPGRQPTYPRTRSRANELNTLELGRQPTSPVRYNELNTLELGRQPTSPVRYNELKTGSTQVPLRRLDYPGKKTSWGRYCGRYPCCCVSAQSPPCWRRTAY